MSYSWWRTVFQQWKPIGQEFLERSVLFTQFLCSIHVFNSHVAQIHQVMGPSMLPTISSSGDILLVEKLSTRFQRISVGDVVMSLSPDNPRILVCKRVLGIQGDRIAYLPADGRGLVRYAVVPKGHVWLQGDNLTNSMDSRHYGPVPYALLEGKVCFRVWPPNGWSRF